MKKIFVVIILVSLLVGCSSPTLEERLSGEWINIGRDIEVELTEGDYSYVGFHDVFEFDSFVSKRLIKYSPDGEYSEYSKLIGKEHFYSITFKDGMCLLSNFTKSDMRSYDIEFTSENSYFQKLNLDSTKSNAIEKFEKDGFDITVNFIDEDTLELIYDISEEQLKGDTANQGMKSLKASFKYVRFVRADD